jgi:hypothetical protein
MLDQGALIMALQGSACTLPSSYSNCSLNQLSSLSVFHPREQSKAEKIGTLSTAPKGELHRARRKVREPPWYG